MNFKEEFVNVYDKSVKERFLRRLPVGCVDKDFFEDKIEWTRKCLISLDSLKTSKEKYKYWNTNMYRMNRSEIELLPADIQDRYIKSYVQYILYKMRIPTLIVIGYFIILAIVVIFG